MSKYTAEQVETELAGRFHGLDALNMLRAFAALLRELENDDAIRAPWAVDRVSLCEVAHKLREIAQSDDPISDVVSRIECHMIDWLRDSVAPPERNREQKREKGATHCDNCGLTWLDDGLNPIGCPYCKDRSAKTSVPKGSLQEGG